MLVGECEAEKPNSDLYNFIGRLRVADQTYDLNIDHFLPKGCQLKNTEYIYGLVVYTGRQTKIMLNMIKTKAKQSNVEKILNLVIILILVIQTILCMVVSILSVHRYDSKSGKELLKFLNKKHPGTEQGVINFFAYFLLLNTMVPISLMVSLEIVK